MSFLEFPSSYNSIIHLKHSSFWPSADVKPMQNDLVHVMHWQSMFALSKCTYIIFVMSLPNLIICSLFFVGGTYFQN
jgi:hypothetical protein